LRKSLRKASRNLACSMTHGRNHWFRFAASILTRANPWFGGSYIGTPVAFVLFKALMHQQVPSVEITPEQSSNCPEVECCALVQKFIRIRLFPRYCWIQRLFPHTLGTAVVFGF
jgi:hypothetical protein